MLQNIVVSILLFLFSGVFAFVSAQTPDAGIKPIAVVGDVVTVGDNKFVVDTKTGPVTVNTTDKSAFKKVSAENPNLAKATSGEFTDVSVGDKLTVSGFLEADGKSVAARSVYFITAADITAKNKKESDEWQRRGVKGRVVAVNPQTNQLELEISGLMGNTKMTLTPKDGAKFLRYADDSVKYDEAITGTLADMKVGDMLRAKGDKSSDGTSFAAEEVIAGSFLTTAGTVKSIDVAKNEVVIKNLQTGKDVTVVIGEASVLKRFPAEQAEMLARVQAMQAMGAMGAMGGGARPIGQPSGNAAATPGGNPAGTPGGQGRAGGGRSGGMVGAGNVDDMLERSPNITATDLKVGDIIALSSTKNANTERIKAIKLYAGVEPFLRSAQTAGRGRRGGGVEGGFSIPGLDGPDFP